MFLLLWEIIIVRISSVSCCQKYCAGHVSPKSNILMLCCPEYFLHVLKYGVRKLWCVWEVQISVVGRSVDKRNEVWHCTVYTSCSVVSAAYFFARTMPEYISGGISCFIHSWHKLICMWCGSSWLQYPRTKQRAFLIYHTERWYQKLCKP